MQLQKVRRSLGANRQTGHDDYFFTLPHVTGVHQQAVDHREHLFRCTHQWPGDRHHMYLPVDAFDREVFDMELHLRLPVELPEVEFILIPSPSDSLTQPLPPNLRTPGWVSDMDALYRDVSALVRLVSHDGMSFMVLEALSRGRHVVYTYPLPHVVHASGFEAVAGAVRDLAARQGAGTLTLNEEGRRYALSHFDRETLIDDLDFRFSKLLR